MRIGFILFVIVSVIVGFIIKLAMKGRMSKALGRSVKDHELSSINSWMEVHEKEDRSRKANQINHP